MSERFLRGLSRIGKLHPQSRPASHDVDTIADVPYSQHGDPTHKLDIYIPRRPSAHPGGYPIVLYVHGGGFRALSKDTHWVMGLGYARAGYLVFNISYRLAPKHPFPAALIDTCTAFEWVVEHAAAYGGDIERLCLAGESAGANLVSALTIATCFERPEPWAKRVFDTDVTPIATLPYCGFLEVSDPERFTRRKNNIPTWVTYILYNCAAAYLNNADRQAPGQLELANPLTTLERAHRHGIQPTRPLPPFCMAVGTRDPLLDDTRRMHTVLTQMGVPVHTHYYTGEIHAFHAFAWRRQARQAWRDTYRFLEQYVQRDPV